MKSIYLIGDSIRQLYCPYVAESLRGQAEVKWPARENCQNTQHVLTNLSRWRINIVDMYTWFLCFKEELPLRKQTKRIIRLLRILKGTSLKWFL